MKKCAIVVTYDGVFFSEEDHENKKGGKRKDNVFQTKEEMSMTTCARCGAPLANGAQLCNNCGAQQNPQGIYRFHFRFAILALLWDLLLGVVVLMWGLIAVATSFVPYSERRGIVEFIRVTLPGMVLVGTMILGIVVKIASIVIATRAKKRQYPKADTSVTLSVLALVLSTAGYVIFFLMTTFLSRF